MEKAKIDFDFAELRAIRQRAVGRLFWQLKRYIDNLMEPQLNSLGYTDFKMSYMMVISNVEEQGTTNNELAKRANVTKQMMSKMVSLLEKERYIYITKNPDDSRSSVIFLDERGKELLVDIRQGIDQVRVKLDGIVGHDRMEAFINTMVELVTALGREEQ
ncbi:DNA-binding MarR family transcriptional regulator [Spirosoma oryzae]|uniref:DNA-binding MarR family transcriptional regulator n=1 Tax=Spirosoma oryzae TaxID=1469603 RepID=A0A2T0T5E6_9BACT|nr:MarR family transcriptional regulator [Spirosoma oryzae]PRY40863.1 DNA-binding MarR family transcriptional regulator [Spirosoma oryzae]